MTKHLATPVNFIVHTIMDVNDQLRRGRPFFVDIARDGIVLYEAPGHPLASPVNLAPKRDGITSIGFRMPASSSTWLSVPYKTDTAGRPRSFCTRRAKDSIIVSCSSWRSTAPNRTS